MKLTRKDLLRISGFGALALAGKKLLRASVTKQWGMVIDLQKCRQDAGCDACIKACNVAHNIPQIPNPTGPRPADGPRAFC